jgi:uncharacterized repeat protein (TIGR03803 family)
MGLGAAGAALTFVVMLGMVTVQSAQAQTFTVLYNFSGSVDGGNPYGGLIRDTAGDLYCTAANGGSSSKGVVYKLNKNDVETPLYTFTGGADGGEPLAGLFRDAAGNFYGTTFAGGTSANGVVFKLSKSGTETVLHSFAGGWGASLGSLDSGQRRKLLRNHFRRRRFRLGNSFQTEQERQRNCAAHFQRRSVGRGIPLLCKLAHRCEGQSLRRHFAGRRLEHGSDFQAE